MRSKQQIISLLSANNNKQLVDNLGELPESATILRNNTQWRSIQGTFCLLDELNQVLEDNPEELLSVQETRLVRTTISSLVSQGVYEKIQPNLPFYKENVGEDLNVLENYEMLKSTCLLLHQSLVKPELRLLLLPEGLRAFLVGGYQMAYCKLLKPGSSTKEGFVMTLELHQNFTQDQKVFTKLLQDLGKVVHPTIYLRETMIIFQGPKTPLWFRKALGRNLSDFMRRKNGVKLVLGCLFDGALDDSTLTWNSMEIFSRIFVSNRTLSDFNVICKQLVEILKLEDALFERTFVCCTKLLFLQDEVLARNLLLSPIIKQFLYLTQEAGVQLEDNCGRYCFEQNVRLLNGLFNGKPDGLPISLLKPIVGVLFNFLNCKLETDNVTSLLRKFLLENVQVFDVLLFGGKNEEILEFQSNLLLKLNANNKIVVKKLNFSEGLSIERRSQLVKNILNNQIDLQNRFFVYLLQGFGPNSCFENDLSCKIVVYELLVELSEEKSVQNYFVENPQVFEEFFCNFLVKSCENKVHLLEEQEADKLQVLFTVVMILQVFLDSDSSEDKQISKRLQEVLVQLKQTKNEELKALIEKCLNSKRNYKTSSKVEQIFEEINDELLPVRGHGLLELSKMVLRKEPEVLAQKQLVLNIFLQHLKSDDSYIYLNAIQGLASLAEVFPQQVLESLCEEYSSLSSQEDCQEIRLKLGEVLVKTTKCLGETASNFKPLLLNTFLNGTRHEDGLVRASSLANLGELCLVLHYKLGSIVSEILVCVHGVVATDPWPEARRAAVTVIRHLLAGLDHQMIAFLKEEILPIYRTLKLLYEGDEDEVVRLQAQLALEQLNANTRGFLMDSPSQDLEFRMPEDRPVRLLH